MLPGRTYLPRRAVFLRWLGLAVLVAVVVAYIQPIRSYRDTQAEVGEQEQQIAELIREGRVLERQLARAQSDAFVEREARRLGLVKPGEKLFIVKGVEKRKRAAVR